MSFAAPGFLAALLVVPAALALRALLRRRGTRYAVRFPGVPTLAAVLPAESPLRRLAPLALFCAALAAAALALARPQATVAVPVERASVVLVMDASRSMLADDVDPSRLDAARSAGLRFLDRVPDELRVGVVGFSDSPHTVAAPSTDRDDARAAIAGLTADGGTATGDAIDAALTQLREDRDGGRRPPPAAIVLLSDGKATRGRDPVAAARDAGRARVPVYTVALGSADATVPGPLGQPLSVAPDPETLRRMAAASGGRAFEADDAGSLDGVYERLGSQIGTRPEKREVSAAFAAGGILLLVAGVGLALRRSARLP